MGQGISKEEQLFLATQKFQLNAIRELHSQGATLEWKDDRGRTPLLVACSVPEGYDATVLLLQLGANIRAFRPGPEGGYPMHHAARRGCDQTLNLLFQKGAEPLLVNDAGDTALSLARGSGRPSTVRLIEDRLALWSGYMRQLPLNTPSFVQAFVPGLVKQVWVVVLPIYVDRAGQPRLQVAIYPAPKVACPSVVMLLDHADIHIQNPQSNDPMLVISDTATRNKVKLSADKDSNQAPDSVMAAFQACRGIPQNQPPPRAPQPQDKALQMALEASLRHPPPPPQANSPLPQNYGGWGSQPPPPTSYGGWGPTEAGPSATTPPPPNAIPASRPDPYKPSLPTQSIFATPAPRPQTQPSAPPLPAGLSLPNPFPVPNSSPPPPAEEEGIHYPSIDKPSTTEAKCVVCWEKTPEGACYPCGHVAGCMECLTEIHKKKMGCPVCRKPIETVLKLYNV